MLYISINVYEANKIICIDTFYPCGPPHALAPYAINVHYEASVQATGVDNSFISSNNSVSLEVNISQLKYVMSGVSHRCVESTSFLLQEE